MEWQSEPVRVADVQTDARFQRRAGVDRARLGQMEAAGRACCGAPCCPHLYEPIEVWQSNEPGGSSLFLLAGHHRLALAELGEVVYLEARVAVGASAEWAIQHAARSNARVRPYAPMEEARIYREMIERGMSGEAIARELDGRAPSYYERRALLAWLSPALQAAVVEGSLRVEYAEAIGEAARAGASPGAQAFLRDLARTTGKRVEVFRALVRAVGAPRNGRAVQGALFALEDDAFVAKAKEVVQATSCALAARDRWHRLEVAGQAILRGGDGCEEARGALSQMIDLARVEQSAIESKLGLGRGEAQSAHTEATASPDEGAAPGPISLIASDADGGLAVVAHPLVKWAGGKRDSLATLLPPIRAALAGGTGRLIEPFAGGAAVTLAVGPREGLLCDSCADLAALYQTVKVDADGVLQELRRLIEGGTDRAAYLRVRATRPEADTPLYAAARLLYLNRLGFNGLYRTNKKGQINVPFGDGRPPAWPTEADFLAAARALRGVKVRCCDWREVLGLDNNQLRAGDTIYVDPPYEGAFDGYGARWSTQDHDHLAARLRLLAAYGCAVFVSQPDTESARARYWGFERLELARAKGHRVGGRATRRKATGELLFSKEG